MICLSGRTERRRCMLRYERSSKLDDNGDTEKARVPFSNVKWS